MNVLIDSYGWIEHFSEGPTAAKYAKFINGASKKTYFTPSVVLYEVYKKIKKLKGEPIALTAYAHIVAHTTIVPLNKRVSLEAAEISLEQDLSMADSIVMATANLTESEIVTSDGHFKGKKNVIFIDKTKDTPNSNPDKTSQKEITERQMKASERGLYKLPKGWKFNRNEAYDRNK